MKESIKRFLAKVERIPYVVRLPLGIISLLLGIAGLVLPFLQGILMILVSIVLFGFIKPEDVDRLEQNLDRWQRQLTKK